MKARFNIRIVWGKPSQTAEYTIQAAHAEEAREWAVKQADALEVPCDDRLFQVVPLQDFVVA